MQQWEDKILWNLTIIWGFVGEQQEKTEPKSLWSENKMYEMLAEGV